MEGKLVASAIARLAERESLEYERVRLLQRGIGFLEETIGGMGFCLSEQGDLLSQWRGFGADATGVSIGFSSDYLNWLSGEKKASESPFFLNRVEYEPSAHKSSVTPTYLKVKQLIDAGAFKIPRIPGLLGFGYNDTEEETTKTFESLTTQATEELTTLYSQLFRLKAYAFREEQEWRLLSYLVRNGEDDCLHRVVHDRIIPYRKIELVELERHPVAEVILGPKHGTPTKVVEDFLKLKGYGLVKVRPSEASYR